MKKRCPNRHALGVWLDLRPARSVHSVRKELYVEVMDQFRAKYPMGKRAASACCTEKRMVLNVVGEIQSARDAKRIAALFAELAPVIEEARTR